MMMRMSLWQRIRLAFLGSFGRALLWLWAKSARIKVLGEEEYRKLRRGKKPVILLIWHGRILLAPYFFRKRGIMPLISPSQDGEIIAQIVSRWGYRVLRGSSSHSMIGPWAKMMEELEQGGEIIIVPDGPRGPHRRLKMGCIKLAQKTGAYLVPFTFSASPGKQLKTWDRFLLFFPFSRVVAIYGPPLAISQDCGEEELEKERQRVETLMHELEERADAYFS